MSQYNDDGVKAFTVGMFSIGRARRVKLSNDMLVVAEKGDRDIGTVEMRAEAGSLAAVRLRTATGTCSMVAAGAIAEGSPVFTADDGMVSDAQATGAFLVGTAMHAVSGAGSIIEVMRTQHGDNPGA